MSGGIAKGLLWVLLGGAVAGAAVFILRQQKPPEKVVVAEIATPTPTPVPATPTPPPATPAPVVIKATPTPLPVVVATPTPPSLDVATVVRTPALWPPQVALVQAYPFPINVNGRAVGEAKAPVGTVLRVLRVGAQQIEVEFQAARHLIPWGATDLMARALATFRRNGSVLPTAPATPLPVAAAGATPGVAGTPMGNPVKIGERLNVEVVRMKRSRIEGGDWDDKTDRIELKVKVTNTDNTMSADKFHGEIFVFAESILDRSAVKVLQTQQFDFSLPPRSTHEFVTEQVTSRYDTTGARFGHKYEGWVLRLKDGAGAVVLVKATTASLQKGLEKAGSLSANMTYDRSTFKEKADTGR